MTVRIRDVRVIDGRGAEPRPGLDVVVADGRIARIEPTGDPRDPADDDLHVHAGAALVLGRARGARDPLDALLRAGRSPGALSAIAVAGYKIRGGRTAKGTLLDLRASKGWARLRASKG